MRVGFARGVTAAATAATLGAAATARSPGDLAAAGALSAAVALGWLVVLRRPDSPVGPALAWCGGSVALVTVVEQLAAGAAGDGSAAALQPFAVGIWPLNLAGVLALLLIYPAGLPQGRGWVAATALYAASLALVLTGLWGSTIEQGRVIEGGSDRRFLTAIGVVGVGAALVIAVGTLVGKFRRGGERERNQLKHLLLAGAVTLALLVGGWMAEALGASVALAYTPFILAIVVGTPAAAAVAVVRHDLLDIDRLLGDGIAWVLTLVLSAVLFGAIVLGFGGLVQRWTAAGASVAGFLVALALLPLHDVIVRWVGRVVDRDRHVALAAVAEFAEDVRAGRREPEEIEGVLRSVHGDGGLRLLLADGPAWVTMDGAVSPDAPGVTLDSGGVPIARLVLTANSARSRRRAITLLRAAWVPIEMARLRSRLRQSQSRVARASAEERTRLERELHDGIQQRLVVAGMRLSLAQRRLPAGPAAEVGASVDEVMAVVEELRRLAQGVRPSRLDDGLGAALAAVADSSPVPVSVTVAEPLPEIDDARALAAYLTVSEAVANVLKHAGATRIDVRVEPVRDRLGVSVRDNGVGGASLPLSLRDRVQSVGGELVVDSPPGGGTLVSAVM